MVTILKKSYVALSIVLTVMLALASAISPSLLTSLFYRIVYVIYAILTLSSVIFIKGVFTKIFHILLALLIGMAIYVKSVNDRFQVTLGTGGRYKLETRVDTLELELIKFSIRHEEGSASAVHYESHLLINETDDVKISVNHPFRHKNMRLYQSAYRTVEPFYFYSNDTLKLFEGQFDEISGVEFVFLEYDPFLGRAAVKYNDILFYLPVGREVDFFDMKMKVLAGEAEIATVLEYVEVKGHIVLLIIGLLLIPSMIFSLIRRKSWK